MVEILRPVRRAVLLQIIRRRIDMDPHGQQMALHEVGLARRRQADRDVGLAHREVELAVVDHHADLYVRVELEELANPRRQPARAEGDGGRDLERAFRAVLQLGEEALGHGELGEDLARRREQQLALLGQDEAAGMAMEQRHGEALLERADLPADRRLAEVQRLTRMGEAAGLGNRVENPQLVPVHPPSPNGIAPRIRHGRIARPLR